MRDVTDGLETGFLEGFEVQDAPLYGAERRGAPVFAYVRADRAPINERGVIRRPDLVVVADGREGQHAGDLGSKFALAALGRPEIT
ncbi:MAG: 2-oxoacid:acceptor oxidoreductase family protein [bacterium]